MKKGSLKVNTYSRATDYTVISRMVFVISWFFTLVILVKIIQIYQDDPQNTQALKNISLIAFCQVAISQLVCSFLAWSYGREISIRQKLVALMGYAVEKYSVVTSTQRLNYDNVGVELVVNSVSEEE